jgi:hypothetical protein
LASAFQQVAPGALARMGLAGDEEHAQLLADALDGDHRLVVGLRELAFQRLGFELHHVGAAVIDAHLQGEGRAGAHGEALEDLPVAAHGDGGGARAAAFQDLGPDGLVPADDAEARRLDQLDLPVALVRAPGHEGVERRAKAHGVHGGRQVVDHAVRDHDDAGEPVRRHVGEAVGERREQARAVVGFPVLRLDEARLHIREAAEAALQLRAHPVGHGGAVAERLRGGAVHHHRDDVLHLLAFLLHQGGVGESQQDEGEREGAHDRDGAAGEECQHHEERRRGAERPQGISGNEGREGQREHRVSPAGSACRPRVLRHRMDSSLPSGEG